MIPAPGLLTFPRSAVTLDVALALSGLGITVIRVDSMTISQSTFGAHIYVKISEELVIVTDALFSPMLRA